MAELTKRGDEDHKRDDEKMKGEPAEVNQTAGNQAAAVTRDKGVEPSKDNRGDGRGEERQ